jgi:hypothetical protein
VWYMYPLTCWSDRRLTLLHVAEPSSHHLTRPRIGDSERLRLCASASTSDRDSPSISWRVHFSLSPQLRVSFSSSPHTLLRRYFILPLLLACSRRHPLRRHTDGVPDSRRASSSMPATVSTFVQLVQYRSSTVPADFLHSTINFSISTVSPSNSNVALIIPVL